VTGTAGKIYTSILDIWGRQLDRLADIGMLGEAEATEVESFFLRARALLRLGKVREAAALFARANEMAPGSEDVLEGRAEALDMAGEAGLASSLYEEHRRIRAQVRRATPDRSFALRRTSRFTAEVADYSWLLRSNRIRAFPYIARGNAHLAKGRPDLALVDYISALGCSPGRAEIVTLQGEAYLMMGRYQDALSAFDRVLEERPGDTEALSGRAIANMASARPEAAIIDWRRQLALLPPERASARACVALRLGDYALARQEFDRALEQEPLEYYWRLYRYSVSCRIREPLVACAPADLGRWPGPLIELLAGRLTTDELMKLAVTETRRVEAHYQLGILALARNPEEARFHFQRVIDSKMVSLIEYCASCRELTRWVL